MILGNSFAITSLKPCSRPSTSTRTTGGTHFYNVVDGKKWDITVSQFKEPIPYDDTISSRESALADTSPEKYALLTSRLEAEMARV